MSPFYIPTTLWRLHNFFSSPRQGCRFGPESSSRQPPGETSPIWKGSHNPQVLGTNTITMGKLTTYPKWDDPPSRESPRFSTSTGFLPHSSASVRATPLPLLPRALVAPSLETRVTLPPERRANGVGRTSGSGNPAKGFRVGKNGEMSSDQKPRMAFNP